MRMLIGANDYKLILLDTNAIREIVTNTNMSGKGFLEKFLHAHQMHMHHAFQFIM